MNYPVELLADVDLYLSNQLTDPARCRAIETRMERDAEFRGVVEAMRQSKQLIDEPALRQLARTVIRNLDAEQRVPVRPLAGQSRSLWPVLTSIAAMLVVLSGVYLTQRSLTVATLAPTVALHREAESKPTPLRPAEKQAVLQFEAGNRAFDEGQYQRAIAYYRATAAAPVSDYLHEAAWWNLSLSCLNLGNTEQAAQYFGQYTSVPRPHYRTPWLDQLTLRAHLLRQRVFGA